MPSFGDELGRLIPHMRRFARALVRGHSMQVADDLVQETVVLAMRAERLARGPHLRSWCLANLIRVHRQWDLMSRGGHDLASRQGGGQGQDTLSFMPREISRLDLLPLDNREVLLLAVLVGLSYGQVAETLHITAETVVARLDLARSILARGDRIPAGGAASSEFASHKPARSAQYLQLVK